MYKICAQQESGDQDNVPIQPVCMIPVYAQQESGDQDNVPIQPVCMIPVYAQQESGDQDNVLCKNPEVGMKLDDVGQL